MVKIWLCLCILLCFPSFLKGDEVIVVLLNKGKCGASRVMERVIREPSLVQQAAENKQSIHTYYGNDCPDYVKQYKVRWFPTILKFEQDEAGEWVEKERVIGEKNLDFLLDFLGKRRIIQVQPPQQQTMPIGGTGSS